MAMKIPLYSDRAKKEAEERGTIDLVDGKYKFEIVDVEVRPRGAQNPQPCVMAKMKILDGPQQGMAWDFWNLTHAEMTDGQRSYTEGFWLRASQALPGLYDEGAQLFEPNVLRGAIVHATVSHETYEKKDGTKDEAMRYRSWRFDPRSTAGAVAASAAPTASTSAKPQKFATP